MDTSSPSRVVQQIGAIEDALAIAQNDHAEQKALEFQYSTKVKLEKSRIRKEVSGANKDARDAEVEELVQMTEPFQEWETAKMLLVKHEVRLEYLSKRLSACQSVLKQFQHDSAPARFGQGRTQDHVSDPGG